MGAEWRRLITTRAVMATAIRATIAAARKISDRPSIAAPQLPLNMVTLPG